MDLASVLTVALAGLLIVTAFAHVAWPDYFATLVPPWRWLPSTRAIVYGSALVEVTLGIGLLVAPTRATAAWATVGLFTVYVVTHIDAFVRARPDMARRLDRRPGAAVRVAVNAAYVAWAAAVAVWATTPSG